MRPCVSCTPEPASLARVISSAPPRQARSGRAAKCRQRMGAHAQRARKCVCLARRSAFAARTRAVSTRSTQQTVSAAASHRQQVAARGIERRRDDVPFLQASAPPRVSHAGSKTGVACGLLLAFFGHCGNVSLKSGSCDTPGHVASVGVPSDRKILKSWSISEAPGKSGRWLSISTKMQPTDLQKRRQRVSAACQAPATPATHHRSTGVL